VRELANAAERHALGLGSPNIEVRLPGSRWASRWKRSRRNACARRCASMGEIKAVMEALQLPRRTLNEKMQRHGLVREDFVGSE
jgi:two-component system C4-dicarboxylate transport response regulator DctD